MANTDIQYHIDAPTVLIINLDKTQSFDVEEHLVFDGEVKTHTMEDINLPSNNGVSSIAVSEPFPLFSEEAINIMRTECLSNEVIKNYSWTSDIAPMQVRGYAAKHAPFTTSAWKHPKTLKIISKIAGIDLVPVFDYEIGHINIAVPGKIQEIKEGVLIATQNNLPVVGWHRDSYPFVCVLMMSDTTGMQGGETALKTGTEEIRKVRGPRKGCAIVLQGRYIEHQALQAFGSQERITSVTSFRPRNPLARDDTVLNTVRPISHLPDLYYQYTKYSLGNLKVIIDVELERLCKDKENDTYDCKRFKEFSGEIISRLIHMNEEIFDEKPVRKVAVAEAAE